MEHFNEYLGLFETLTRSSEILHVLDILFVTAPSPFRAGRAVRTPATVCSGGSHDF